MSIEASQNLLIGSSRDVSMDEKYIFNTCLHNIIKLVLLLIGGEEVETVTISKEEYEHLLDRVEFLNCLEACGVDNWGGYSDAHEMMNEEE